MASAPAHSAGLWQWFAGGSVGYLTDLDDAMYNLQLGAESKVPGSQASHSVYLEVGFAQDEAKSVYNPPIFITGASVVYSKLNQEIIPITLNYKFEAPLTGHLNYYLGLGLGIAILDSSCDWNWTQTYPPFARISGSDDQTKVRFYGDVFAGLSYDVCSAFNVSAGVRYIFMDNVHQHVGNTNATAYNVGINNDLLIELGARIKF